jgi:hypothetical protein
MLMKLHTGDLLYLPTHSNFGQNRTTIMDTLHEDLQAFLRASRQKFITVKFSFRTNVAEKN